MFWLDTASLAKGAVALVLILICAFPEEAYPQTIDEFIEQGISIYDRNIDSLRQFRSEVRKSLEELEGEEKEDAEKFIEEISDKILRNIVGRAEFYTARRMCKNFECLYNSEKSTFIYITKSGHWMLASGKILHHSK